MTMQQLNRANLIYARLNDARRDLFFSTLARAEEWRLHVIRDRIAKLEAALKAANAEPQEE